MTFKRIRVNESIQSATASLKALITIISGLAATTVVVQLLTIADGDLGKIQLLPSLLFVISLLTIVRFYHGNCRHLDEEYTGRAGKAYANPPRFGGISTRVASDFLVIFLEALLLVTLSLLLDALRQYIIIFSILLFIDAVWFYFMHHTDHPRSKAWAGNNLIFSFLTFILGISFKTDAASNQAVRGAAVLFFALFLINFILDIANQFEFYFPGIKRGRQIYLAAPFTSMLREGKFTNDEFRNRLNGLYEGLDRRGYNVFSAHRREKWGDDRYAPETALDEDLKELDEADVLVALVGDPPSPGVQLEIGAALILNKPIIVIIHPHGSHIPYLNEAFRRRDDTYIIASQDLEDWIDKVTSILDGLNLL